MAIWLTKGRAQYGPVFGSADQFEGLGIFLDTYANDRHTYSFPRVMAMIGDGHQKYDLASDGDPNSAGACSASIRRNDIKTMVRIIYKKGESLKVLLQHKGWDEWTPCFELKDLTLPSNPYLGVTAVTGDVHDAHDVISISTSSIIAKPTTNTPLPDSKFPKSAMSSSGGSWLGFILKVSLFGGFCAAGFQAYKVYYLQNGRWSNKRF